MGRNIQQEAQYEAQRQLDELRGRIPRLTIRIEGANANDVTVSIDDVQVPSALVAVEHLVDPGQRRVIGRLGNAEVSVDTSLSEGERKEVILKFALQVEVTPDPPPAVRPSPIPLVARAPGTERSDSARTWGWVGVGVGAAGLALGATTGIVLAAKNSSLNSDCPNNQCKPGHWSEADTFNTLRYVSTIGFLVGAVGAATGMTLLAIHPKQDSKPHLGLWLSPTSAGAKGSF